MYNSPSSLGQDCAAQSKELAIVTALKRQGDASDRLASLLCSLENRLEAVCTPYPPTPTGGGAKCEAARPASPLEGEISNRTSAISSYADRIGNLLERLEL